MNYEEPIDSEIFYNFITEFIQKLQDIQDKYKLDLNHVPDILDALGTLIDGLEKLNQEILSDFQTSFDTLLTKLEKHYDKYNDSKDIARVIDIYHKYFN